MKIKSIQAVSLSLILALVSCKSQQGKLEFLEPDSGQRVAFGAKVTLKLNFPSTTLDSVVYSIDGEPFVTKTDTGSVELETSKFGYGDKSLSAKIYAQGKEDIAYSNVLVMPAAAKNYAFEVVNEYPHDTLAYTQGLQYENGVLYETTGQPMNIPGALTSLRKVNLETGKIISSIKPSEEFFGEGMTIVGDKIIFLTWMKGKAFVYDKHSFKQLSAFDYGQSREGWGLAYDGQKLIKSDGSSKLYFLNAQTGKEEGHIEVYDENGRVGSLNELEYIDGKVYANIYGQDIIVVINPESGAVESRINLVGLYTEGRQPTDNELNGIAYDATNKRFFVTGKLWPKLYEIKLIER